MGDLNDLFSWLSSFNRPDPQLASVTEWLELENRDAIARGGRSFLRSLLAFLGFVLGMSLIAVVGVVLGIQHAMLGHSAQAITYAIGTSFCAVFSGAFFSRWVPRVLLPRQVSSRVDRSPEALRAIAQLRNVHGYRGLKREVGEHGVTELSEGAQLYLRCRSSLTSETWSAQSEADTWGEAREQMLTAMRSAMDRLALFVVRKRSFAEIGPVLEEMRLATTEAERITLQRSRSAGSAGQDLRASLQRMKELADAEQELLRMRVE